MDRRCGHEGPWARRRFVSRKTCSLDHRRRKALERQGQQRLAAQQQTRASFPQKETELRNRVLAADRGDVERPGIVRRLFGAPFSANRN